MNSQIEWWKNRDRFQKISIVIIVDLLILVATLFLGKLIFLYYLLLNILIVFNIIPLYYIIMLNKQPVGPRDYYFRTIEKNYMYLDENLLTKIFEIRLNNMRQFIFAYLVLIVTFTLTITFNPEAHNYFKEVILGVDSYKIVTAIGTIGTFFLVYYTFSTDRFTLNELEFLFKAKEKLKQLKEPNSPQMQENSNCASQNKTKIINSFEEENLPRK